MAASTSLSSLATPQGLPSGSPDDDDTVREALSYIQQPSSALTRQPAQASLAPPQNQAPHASPQALSLPQQEAQHFYQQQQQQLDQQQQQLRESMYAGGLPAEFYQQQDEGWGVRGVPATTPRLTDSAMVAAIVVVASLLASALLSTDLASRLLLDRQVLHMALLAAAAGGAAFWAHRYVAA